MFRESVWWGVAHFFIPLVDLLFLLVHFRKAWPATKISLAGGLLIVAAAFLSERSVSAERDAGAFSEPEAAIAGENLDGTGEAAGAFGSLKRLVRRLWEGEPESMAVEEPAPRPEENPLTGAHNDAVRAKLKAYQDAQKAQVKGYAADAPRQGAASKPREVSARGPPTDAKAPRQTPGLGADLQATLARIDSGQRLSFRHDGAVFHNRENLLPAQSDGYYREWVHPTPGTDSPGARRVVTGADGEAYYTANHYGSFRKIRDSKK
jgi:guanyl-specific ribonuclease Sa